ncbi:MAG: hypothetical protein AAFR44_06005, partial [Pseudomonadota bacterium]
MHSVFAVVALSGALAATSALATPVYTLEWLGDLPGGSVSSRGSDINEAGQVVGQSSSSNGSRAFIWDPVNGMRDLGDIPGGANSLIQAYAINDLGQVVGTGRVTEPAGPEPDAEPIESERAFLWDPVTGMEDLGDLPGGAFYSEARDINNRGQVTGFSDTGNGWQVFLWDRENGLQDQSLLPGGDFFCFNDDLCYTNFALGLNDAGQ